ncbi:MAG: DUF1848 domain-containing protein [Betaproteobacteria bacterium]
MIISASRRTDIPKFLTEWFMDCIRAGHCRCPSPFNPKQVFDVSLRPEDVEVIVFWSKDPEPMLARLHELDRMGFRYYFHFTLNGYPSFLEPGVPPLEKTLATFARLSAAVSPERVIWRYDPLVLTNVTDASYHKRRFREIATALAGKTRRVVISLLDDYRGSRARLRRLAEQGIQVAWSVTADDAATAELLASMARTARESGMEITSCAEEKSLESLGIKRGKCIDDEYIARVFGIRVPCRKDPGQRAACGCVVSRDIGVYGTCRHGCVYCYAR